MRGASERPGAQTRAEVSASASAGSTTSAGASTLVVQAYGGAVASPGAIPRIQLKDVPAAAPADDSAGVHAAAERGTSGAGGQLPHLARIQQLFGRHDISGIRAHTDGAAQESARSMGAQGYATGNDVAFQGSPDLHTAAHEAAHVVQQRAGVHLKGGVGEAGDSHERHADAVADKVVAGESAEGLLDQYGSGGGSSSARGPVQHYHVEKGSRVADDGQMAVLTESAIGGKTAYADPGVIADAGAKLAKATSKITLEAGKLKFGFKDEKGKKHDLVDIVPTNLANSTTDQNLKLWADCGKAARTVSGMDGGTGTGGGPTAAKYSKGGEEQVGDASLPMAIQKVQMFVDLFTTKNAWYKVWKPKLASKLDLAGIKTTLATWKAKRAAANAETDKTAKAKLQREASRLEKQLDEMSRAEYNKLDKDEKLKFDEAAGINRFADPAIGEAFHISSGGNDHPDKPEGVGTWNFHWGGVVMKTGGDTMTMEGYAVGDPTVQNTDWAFQMYGVGKEDQSFHDEHKDGHRQHGDAPTTMTATRPDKG